VSNRTLALVAFCAGLTLAACQAAPPPSDLAGGQPGPQAAVRPDSGYLQLAGDVIDVIGQTTRILSGLGSALSSQPEAAAEAEELVRASKRSFGIARGSLVRITPPAGHEELHNRLVEALELYIRAADALLPQADTGSADPEQFQRLMPEGGKNAHAAIAALEELRRAGG